MDLYSRKNNWEKSYENRDNFVYVPHEEVVRFISTYIRKRIGLNDFLDIKKDYKNARILDLGCGIGRHIIYFNEMNLDAFGIDLSQNAINNVHQWAKVEGVDSLVGKVLQGDVRDLPWEKNFFDIGISVGVLDSMEFTIAREACAELARVVKKNGLVYIDLISGEDSNHEIGYTGEEIVNTIHENNTIQSYFDYEKIERLVDSFFTIEACTLIKREEIISGSLTSRYHIILKNLVS